MFRMRFSVRAMMLGVVLAASYCSLLVRTWSHAKAHAVKSAKVETTDLKFWPNEKLTLISNFSVEDRSTLFDWMMLRSKLVYLYDAQLTLIPNSDYDIFRCNTSFTVSPFSAVATNHSQQIAVERRYSNFPLPENEYSKY